MTENKRFTIKAICSKKYSIHFNGAYNLFDNGELLDGYEVTDLLNNLDDENKRLKEEIILIEKVKDDFYDKTKSLLHEFIEYYQLKPGNNDNVTDCLEELKKELFE